MVTATETRVASLDGAAAIRERRTTQELVFEFLRDSILTGRLRGGARLVQDKLANDLQVSRVPVREALLQLEREGLVRMEAHRGASVVWLSPEEVQEIFEIRLLLMGAAVRKVVPQLTEEQVARLEQIANRQERETSMAARMRLNRQFYATLFESLNRPRLLAMIEKLEREVERYLVPVERPHLGHLGLVDACRDRDAEQAAQLTEHHISRVAERAVSHLRELRDAGESPAPARRPRRRQAEAPSPVGRGLG